jgi:putative DNA primase/helicase
VFIKNRGLYRVIALWIIATYLHDLFEYMGYLFIHSPQMSSGKTTLLSHLNLLVHNPTGVTCSPTEAVLFRTAKNHTQLLDEGDGWDNATSLRRVLNSGFQRDGAVERCEQKGNGEFDVKKFPVYGPKALAGIGTSILSPTTQSRTFFIEMLRKTKTEITRRRRGATVPGADALKQRIAQWAVQYRAEIARCYDFLSERTLPYLEQFTDRTQDVSEPLAVILETMYKDSPDLERVRAELVEAISATRNESNALAEVQTLLALERIMGEGLALAEPPKVLADLINASNCGIQTNDLAVSQALRSFGFEQKNIRKDTGPRRCYVIERSQLKDLITRYAGANAESAISSQRSQPEGSRG